MGLLNSSVPNLLNGVSQQADALRNPTNCADQTNAYPSPVEGLMKRHPTEFMTDNFSVVTGTEALDTSSHVINRDTGEKYLVAVKPTYIDGGELEIRDLVNNTDVAVHYDQAEAGEEFGSGPVNAIGMIYCPSVVNGVHVTITSTLGESRKFVFTTATPGTGQDSGEAVSGGGTYVNIYQMTSAEDIAGELTATIQGDWTFPVTPIHLGSSRNYPYTLGELPTDHPLWSEGSTSETPGIAKNVLLSQDWAGANGNTDMTVGGGSDSNLEAFNFGENGLTAGADGDTGDNSAMESDPRDYLKALDPATAFKFLTVGDVTYVVNTEREVQMHKTLSNKHGNQGLITIKQGAYNTEYLVKIDGLSRSYTTTSTAGQGKTTSIATGLTTSLNGGNANAYQEDDSVDVADWTSDGSGQWAILNIDVNIGSGSPSGSELAFTIVGKNIQFTSLPGSPRYKYRKSSSSGGTTLSAPTYLELNTNYKIFSTTDIGSSQRRISLWGSEVNGMAYPMYYYSRPSSTSAIKGQYTQSATWDYMEFATEGSNVLMHTLDSTRNFTLQTSDSVGNTYLEGFKERTQYLTDLPAQAPNGFTLRVDGDVENNIDDYYVTFKTRNEEPYGEGMWTEAVGSQIPHQYDYATMPHVLIRQADGSFLFKAANGLINAPPAQVPRVTTDSVTGAVYDPDNGNATGDYDVVVDGLTPHIRIPKYSDIVFDQGTADQRTLTVEKDVEVDQYGKGHIELTTTIGVDYANDEEVVINIKSDYAAFSWRGREAGDETTNPDPSFIGKKINNIFFYENRLGFLAGENCILSETGEFFNFFRVTIIDLLDTAPIDLAVSTNEIAILRHALPYKGNLLLFSDNQQFALGSGRQALSNETVALTQTSYDECNPLCNPVASGSSLYFGYDRGGYSGMRQMMLLDAQGDNYASADITDHVPQYVPNSWKMLASMPQQSLIIGLPEASSGEMQDLYLYKFMDRGNERVQSAWFKYSLPLMGDSDDQKQIIGIHAIDNILYVLCQWRYVSSAAITGGKTYLYKMRIENDRVDDNSIHVTGLDSRVSYNAAGGAGADGVTAAYDSPVSSKTTFTLPFTWSGSVIKAYTKATDSDGGGAALTIDTQDGAAGTLVIDGDKTGSSIWFGLDYTMTYEFSKPVIKGQAGRGSSILAAGRFQVLSCDLSFDDTTTFTATVTNPGRANDYTYTQLASSTDVLSTVQGSNAITSGNFRIPIHTKSDAYTLTITSSSPFPVHFMSAEYEAQYNARSRRMSI